MMKQLTAMVAKMGDLGGAADVAATTDIGEGDGMLRPVVKAIGTNVSDLVEVLCGPNNAALFLKFGSDEPSNNEANENEKEGNDDSMNNEEAAAEELAKKNENKINASEQAGGLSTLLLSCAYGLPLQTPSYAALTLGVDVKAPKETHAGFAKRCIELGMRIFGRDLDLALECAVTNGDGTSHNATNGISGDSATHGLSEEEQVAILKQREDQRCFAEQFGGSGNGSQIDAYCRVKLLLRYFAHLATIGVVSLEEQGEMSLVGMLETLVEAASRAAHHASEGGGRDEKSRALLRASQLLASLVLSTIPYLLNMPEMGNARNRLAEMVDALENNVVGLSSSYSSEYDPGSGPASILLKGELDDAPVGTMDDDDDDEEEEDDDDDDDDEQPAPCADTLQDLLRTVRKLISAHNDSPSTITRFALLDDVPWMALTTDGPAPMEGGMEMEGTIEKVPMSYEGEPLMLDLIGGDEHRCRSIPYLMSIENYTGTEGETVQLRCHSLDGIIYGRLSIFDAPPNPDDYDDEEDAKKTNPNLESYVKTFSLVDRFFLSDAVRDVLTCHRPMVSDAGAERNTAKEVAEQIWDVSHLFKPPVAAAAVEGEDSNNLEASKGIEYGIIETLLSLIVQCTPPGSSMPSSSPTNSHLYLSRVLLELTKLKPSLIPQAIVLATSDMFQDFLPSFTPTARENLAKWLGFHLVNTEYQWPKAYWDHWAPYAGAGAAGKRSSRGEFIQMALNNMAILSSDGAVAVVKECLPAGSALVQTVFLNGHPDKEKEEEVSSTEKDLINRLWNTSEDPDTIRQFIISDELSESHTAATGITENADNSMTHRSVWWRARLATRALFHPILREKLRTARVTENAWKLQSKSAAADDGGGDDDNANNEGMDDDNNEEDETEDLLADVLDAISRFKPVLLAALARDADAYDSIASGKVDDDALLLAGEESILQEVGNIVPKWDLIMGSALMECLMRNGIVSGLAVARWALTEHGDESMSEGGGEGGVIHTDWWKYVSLAILHTLRKSCSQFELSKTDLGGGIGMIIDDGNTDNEDPAETAALRLDEALKSTVPILKYVTERACQGLAACAEEKKIPLSGADLVEGMKCLLRAVLFHFNSIVLTSSSGGGAGILTAANVQKGFASMDADGEKLALVCQAAIGSCKGEQGKRLLQSLSLSLEKML